MLNRPEAWPLNPAQRELLEEAEAELTAEVARFRPRIIQEQDLERVEVWQRVDELTQLAQPLRVEAQSNELPQSVAELLTLAGMGKGKVDVSFKSGLRATYPNRSDLSYLRERYLIFSLREVSSSYIAELRISVTQDPNDRGSFVSLGIFDSEGRGIVSPHRTIEERVRQLKEIRLPRYTSYHLRLVSELSGFLSANQPR